MGNRERNSGRLFGEALKETGYFLTILFCALRACGVVNWNWFWVMSPIFCSWALALVALCVSLVIAIILKLINSTKENNDDD